MGFSNVRVSENEYGLGISREPRSWSWGGVVRDANRDVIVAFPEFFGHVSAIQAEAKVLARGLQICASRGFSQVMVEIDSRPLWLILNSIAPGSILICPYIWRIRSFSGIIHSMSHCFREGNSVADSLASLSFLTRSFIEFASQSSLPKYTRALEHLDRLGICNFQFRKG